MLSRHKAALNYFEKSEFISQMQLHQDFLTLKSSYTLQVAHETVAFFLKPCTIPFCYHYYTYFFTPHIFLHMIKQSSCRFSLSISKHTIQIKETLQTSRNTLTHTTCVNDHLNFFSPFYKAILYYKKYPMSDYFGYKRTAISLSADTIL